MAAALSAGPPAMAGGEEWDEEEEEEAATTQESALQGPSFANSGGTAAASWRPAARRMALATVLVGAAAVLALAWVGGAAGAAGGDLLPSRGKRAMPHAMPQIRMATLNAEGGLSEEFATAAGILPPSAASAAAPAPALPSTDSADELSKDANGMLGMPFLDMEKMSSDGSDPGMDGSQAGPVSCGTLEEHFLGMCYKKCKLLTKKSFPVRVAPNICCKEWSVSCFSPDNVDVNLGYAKGSDGGHPHPPGACDANEEQHLGLCYKKCSILTNQEYTKRVAAGTCCNKSKGPCYNPSNLKTSAGQCSGYNVGGGSKGHECPHPPITGTVSAPSSSQLPS